MTRDLDATPAEVMRAHTDPELFARWVGPNGMETGAEEGYAELDALLAQR
jgi:uncharacterized protein YndB with AHSA1/START domain